MLNPGTPAERELPSKIPYRKARRARSCAWSARAAAATAIPPTAIRRRPGDDAEDGLHVE